MSTASETATAPGEPVSYERIFKSTFVIGGASVLNVLIGIVRMKAVALLLGPTGVGLIGLLNAIMTTAATAAQVGMGTVGTRQIAEAHASGDVKKLAITRRSLLIATIVLAAVGGLAVWGLQIPLARIVVGDPGSASSIALLALGVGLSVAAVAQSAVIRGMRRMKDLALITVLGALMTTLIGVPLIWWLGREGIALYVVLGPLASFLLGHFFVSRLPRTAVARISFAQLRPHWAMFLRLGIPFMGASIAAMVALLIIRVDVRSQLGMEALGYFQASWTIAAQYVGFVLGAMAADYYPRLTAAISKPEEAAALVNQQTEVALLLSGPVILAMLGLAPLVVAILYSSEFEVAGDILRWQALGTVLKVASWPLGFIMLAAGAGRAYFITETVTLVLMVVLIHVLIPPLGLPGVGVAYLVAYIFYLPLVYWLAARHISFAWSRNVRIIIAALTVLVLVLSLVIVTTPTWTLVATLVCGAIYSGIAAHRLYQAGFTAVLSQRLSRIRARAKHWRDAAS